MVINLFFKGGVDILNLQVVKLNFRIIFGIVKKNKRFCENK